MHDKKGKPMLHVELYKSVYRLLRSALLFYQKNPIIVCKDKVEAVGIIMTQLSLKQGLKTWGKQAETSAIKEMQQMHNVSAFFPRDAKSMSREERIKALRSIIFVNKKTRQINKNKSMHRRITPAGIYSERGRSIANSAN